MMMMMNRKNQLKALCKLSVRMMCRQFPSELFFWASTNSYATTTTAAPPRIAPVKLSRNPVVLHDLSFRRTIEPQFCRILYWKRDPICYSPSFLNSNLHVSRNPTVQDLYLRKNIEPQGKKNQMLETANKDANAAEMWYCMFGGSDEETRDMDHDSADGDDEGNSDTEESNNESSTEETQQGNNAVNKSDDDINDGGIKEDTQQGNINDDAVKEDDEEDTDVDIITVDDKEERYVDIMRYDAPTRVPAPAPANENENVEVENTVSETDSESTNSNESNSDASEQNEITEVADTAAVANEDDEKNKDNDCSSASHGKEGYEGDIDSGFGIHYSETSDGSSWGEDD